MVLQLQETKGHITGIQSILNNSIWKETTSTPVSEILPTNRLLCETRVMKILFVSTPVILTKAKQVVFCATAVFPCVYSASSLM